MTCCRSFATLSCYSMSCSTCWYRAGKEPAAVSKYCRISDATLASGHPLTHKCAVLSRISSAFMPFGHASIDGENPRRGRREVRDCAVVRGDRVCRVDISCIWPCIRQCAVVTSPRRARDFGANVRRRGRPLRQGGLLKIEREGADVAFISALPAFLTHRAYTLASLRLRRMTGPQDLQEGGRVT